jgi:two-component system LytT family sensor kinase
VRRQRQSLLGGIVALILSLLISTQHALVITAVRWSFLFALELPVWVAWCLLAPMIALLAQRWPLSGPRLLRNALLHLLAALACSVLIVIVASLLRSPIATGLLPFARNDIERSFLVSAHLSFPLFLYAVRGYTVFWLVIYAALVAIFQSVAYHRAYRQRLVRESELEALLVRTQLDALKFQLQPHFVFNTLHTISALMSRDVKEARRVVIQLSDLLRAALSDQSRHEIPLREELRFLNAYVAIQQARFRDAIAVAVFADSDAEQLAVPRMLFQPLVENSIRHGARHDTPVLHVEVVARRRNNRLILSVADDGYGLAGPLREGIGLANTRARLAHLYPSDHQLNLVPAENGGLVVSIDIPAREATRAVGGSFGRGGGRDAIA